MSPEEDYFTRVPLVIPSVLLVAGIRFVMTLAPAQTLALRFSQTFFIGILTILPLSIIPLGGVIIYYCVKERKVQRKKITYSMIDIGSVIGLLGTGMFIFYVLD
jgi:hypothetical protein